MSVSRRLPFWVLCLLIVIALHALVFYFSMLWRPQMPAVQMQPAAMLIELAPLPAAPKSTPTPIAPAEPDPIVPPPVAEAPKPKIAIAKKPEVKPQPPKPKPQPKPEPKPEPVAKTEPRPQPAQQIASSQSTNAPTQAQPAPVRDEQGEIDRERALWMAKVQAHLSQRLHYPDSERRFNRVGSKHEMLLHFTVDTRGQILTSNVKRSSARANFDREIQRQLRRASPIPPPPSKVLSSGELPIDYPITFTLTR